MTGTIGSYRVRVLKPFRFYRKGAVLTTLSRGQADMYVRRGLAEWYTEDESQQAEPVEQPVTRKRGRPRGQKTYRSA